MSHNDHQQGPVVYPPPVPAYSPPPPQSYPPPAAAPPQAIVAQYDHAGYNNDNQGPYYVSAPPPAGYPTNYNYGPTNSAYNNNVPPKTNSKGEGFWKGCVAALCCCWVLDFCCC